jgi:hypothetical protein
VSMPITVMLTSVRVTAHMARTRRGQHDDTGQPYGEHERQLAYQVANLYEHTMEWKYRHRRWGQYTIGSVMLCNLCMPQAHSLLSHCHPTSTPSISGW